MSVVALKALAPKADESVVEALEDMLERAKEGRVRSVVVVLVDNERDPCSALVTSGDHLLLVGTMEIVKKRILEAAGR